MQITYDFFLYEYFRSLIDIPEEPKEAVCAILKSLATRFLEVINNQLKDFLEGGKYHAVDDPELRQRLQHSKLTNMISEQCFGDLDFSMFKRRNASAHHHTSINMLKRNKSLTEWFCKLSPAEQKSTLARAAATHKQLRQKSRAAEKQALMTRRHILEEQRRKKAALEEKKRQKKMSIIDQLKPHNGPCVSTRDVQHLLSTYPKTAQKTRAVQAELQYHKVILGKKSHLLAVTRKLPQLITNLREFLGIAENDGDGELDPEVGAEEAEVSDEDVPELDDMLEAAPSVANPRKRQRIAVEEESDDEGEEEESDDEQAMEVPDFNFSFNNTRPGMLVAVGYENDVYVGEVENILTSATAVVNFMSQCKQKQTTFKWPETVDKAEVDQKFVLASDFNMSTTNGRFWTLSQAEHKLIQAKYRAFKQLYF